MVHVQYTWSNGAVASVPESYAKPSTNSTPSTPSPPSSTPVIVDNNDYASNWRNSEAGVAISLGTATEAQKQEAVAQGATPTQAGISTPVIVDNNDYASNWRNSEAGVAISLGTATEAQKQEAISKGADATSFNNVITPNKPVIVGSYTQPTQNFVGEYGNIVTPGASAKTNTNYPNRNYNNSSPIPPPKTVGSNNEKLVGTPDVLNLSYEEGRKIIETADSSKIYYDFATGLYSYAYSAEEQAGMVGDFDNPAFTHGEGSEATPFSSVWYDYNKTPIDLTDDSLMALYFNDDGESKFYAGVPVGETNQFLGVEKYVTARGGGDNIDLEDALWSYSAIHDVYKNDAGYSERELFWGTNRDEILGDNAAKGYISPLITNMPETALTEEQKIAFVKEQYGADVKDINGVMTAYIPGEERPIGMPDTDVYWNKGLNQYARASTAAERAAESGKYASGAKTDSGGIIGDQAVP
ncbi:MAG: hypothetical protein M0R51_17985, partial [Clostridia bacterium]|nr:hypothetical protein [Clostridia bacterium]